MSRVSPQLIVFSYHKSGTSLFLHVMTKICERLGLSLVNHFGFVDRIGLEPDVVLLPHSLLPARVPHATSDHPLDRPYRAIRMIRDPRDIWVSGYLYHRHCIEEWCINTDMDPSPPIQWPQVDHSFAHWPEDWKRDYLARLNGKSYQQHLLDLSQQDGLEFELEGYTGRTIAAMREWKRFGVSALDVRLEDMMADYDGTMLRVFDHFGLTAEQTTAALDAARTEDIRRMDEATIAARPQIHSRVISKWREVLSPAQVAAFEACHGDLILELGYPLTSQIPGVLDNPGSSAWFIGADAPLATGIDEVALVWPRPPEAQADVTAETRGADIHLSAGGAIIRPTVSDRGAYSFVVPPGAERVSLESRRVASVDPRAPYLGDSRCLGVRVSAMAIRFRAGEVVIPADDPRLITGWHAAEQSGAEIWRWTDGSAELPWDGVSGPTVLTVWCTAPGEHPVGDAAPDQTAKALD